MKKFILLSVLLAVGCDNSTEPKTEDCAGVADGTAVEDNCGVCSGENEYCITDIDGYWYKTATIGTQLWMVENLQATHYRNRDIIDYYDYKDKSSNSEIYGRLYDWNAVINESGICPEEFQVPSNDEWTILIDYLGGATVAGGKMKEVGHEHWEYHSDEYTEDATNESGFSGLPGGYRDKYGNYFGINKQGFFWSSTEDINDSDNAWRRSIEYNSSEVYGFYWGMNKISGLSIRCIKD